MSVNARARRVAAATSLPAEEMDRRRLIVRDAHHSNRVEGVAPNPKVEHIFEAFIAGEIEAEQLVPYLTRHHAAR